MDLIEIRNQIQGQIKGKISINEPMSRHTTWRVGGPADLFLEPKGWSDIEKALNFVSKIRLPVTIIGGGSNILVADNGIRGLVIRTPGGLNKIDINGERVKVEAGASLPFLAVRTGQKSLTGLEFASGIPGTVGGAVIMNAGAHGGAMEQVVEMVTVMDRQGKIHHFSNKEMNFKYRSSRLKGSSFIVLETTLVLRKGYKEEILEKMKHHKLFRTEKQPWQYPNAGSVFKNPPQDSAGRLIDGIGAKGWQVGKAQVAMEHANFIVNLGGATSNDILGLMEKIQNGVKKEYGITLEPEIIFLGG